MALIRSVYLDTAAATPLDPAVLRAMQPYLQTTFANPASLHEPGLAAAKAVLGARQNIAAGLGAHADEIIFTGGGTEGNNLAILGATQIGRAGHLITTAIEHSSVLEPCRALARRGWRVDYLPVSAGGLLDPKTVARALRPDTILVSIAYVNNEIGTIQPLKEIARVIHRFGRPVYFHTDACQAPRFLPLGVEQLGVDLMTLNGAKLYGPKGVGCLYRRRGVKLAPLVYGGGQETGQRAGTENVPGIVGLATALALCERRREKDNRRIVTLRDYFIRGLLHLDALRPSGQMIEINGTMTARVANNVNVTVAGVSGEQLVIELAARGVACSTGAACAIRAHDESYVIMALGRTRAAAESSLRFTLDRKTTKTDLDYVLKLLPPILERLIKN